MAHNITQYDAQEGIEQAWHGLTKIRPVITLDDNWLTKWDTVPVRLQKNGKDSKWSILEVSDIKDLEIGQPYNPETFKPITNKAFVELVRQSIAGTPHKIVSDGSVRQRGRIFMSLELNGMEQFKAAGRQFSAYLNFGNGHDKSSVLWVNTSNTCTVCDNTFTINLVAVENKITAINDDISFKQRHTKNVELRLPEMAKMIDKAIGVQAQFQLELEKFHAIEIPTIQVSRLFAGFIGRNVTDKKKGLSSRAKNTADKLFELHTQGKGNNGRTLADAFSAVTDYYTHFSSGGENKFRQVLSSEYGAGLKSKIEFRSLLNDSEAMEETIDLGEELLTNTKD